MSVAETIPAEWVKKAEEDLLSGRAVLKDGAPSTGCFLAQQAAEKLLKAVLVAQNVEFPKTHDLLQLLSLLDPRVPESAILKEDLVLLNRYNIEPRYPGDYPELTREECQRAYDAALRVQKFAEQRLEEHRATA